MFLENRNISFKIKRSKVTDYAALKEKSLSTLHVTTETHFLLQKKKTKKNIMHGLVKMYVMH